MRPVLALLTIIACVKVADSPTARGKDAAPQRPLDGQPLAGQRLVQTDADYRMPTPPNLLAEEEVSATRGADGHCDWSTIRIRRKQDSRTEGAYFGEKHESTCKGVIFHVRIPKEYQVGGAGSQPMPGMWVDTTVMLSPSVWSGPDTITGRGRETRDIVNAVQRELVTQARIDAVTIRGNTAWVRTFSANSNARGVVYRLQKKSGAWAVSPEPTKDDRGATRREPSRGTLIR